ncbi:hypothetical protein RB195_004573 [Necator americanus]|uniref:Reverse transcriptase domain-containing protein n=1 Tax=Necator americanus TaxID=51031 RepID=A0ABR1BLX5_NECAM
MRGLEWDNMGVEVDGRHLHHLRFADDIVLITSSINQAGRMLAEFDETCENVGREIDMMNDLASELDRTDRRKAWGFKNIEDIVKRKMPKLVW